MRIETAVIVGARGAMGGMLAKRCERAGITVRRLDKAMAGPDIALALDGADLALISVPAEAVADVAASLAAHMDGTQIMADVCSVKIGRAHV